MPQLRRLHLLATAAPRVCGGSLAGQRPLGAGQLAQTASDLCGGGHLAIMANSAGAETLSTKDAAALPQKLSIELLAQAAEECFAEKITPVTSNM